MITFTGSAALIPASIFGQLGSDTESTDPISRTTVITTNQMARFEIFVGTWAITGEVLETNSAPAAKLLATDT